MQADTERLQRVVESWPGSAPAGAAGIVEALEGFKEVGVCRLPVALPHVHLAAALLQASCMRMM